MNLKSVNIICFVSALNLQAAMVQKFDIERRFPLLSEGLVVGTHFTFVSLQQISKEGLQDQLNEKEKVKNTVRFSTFCCNCSTSAYVCCVFQKTWQENDQPNQLRSHFILPENLIFPIYRYDPVKKIPFYEISDQNFGQYLVAARLKWRLDVTQVALDELISEKNS